MSFTKKTWINKGETGYENSKLNADNLNNLEDRIANGFNNKTILFSGNSSTDIELSDSVSNYDFIEFFYKTANNISKSIKIPTTATHVTLDATLQSTSTNTFLIYSRTIAINEKNITNYSYQNVEINGTSVTTLNANSILITQVIGYK